MRNWNASARLMALLVCAMLWLAPGPAGAQMKATPAQVDSLVWYVEQLEHDLAICKIRGDARADSLGVELAGAKLRLEWALEDRPRWWERPSLMFVAGAAVAMVILGQIVKVTF